MATKPKTTRTRINSKERAVYDNAHGAWRAGAIHDFYYGKRSPSDSTIVWRVNELEYSADQRDEVAVVVDAAKQAAGIGTIELGDRWCGFQTLTVHYSDGRCWTEHYDQGRVRQTYRRADQPAYVPGSHGVIGIFEKVETTTLEDLPGQKKPMKVRREHWQVVETEIKATKPEPIVVETVPAPVVDSIAAKPKTAPKRTPVASSASAGDRLAIVQPLYEAGKSIPEIAGETGIPRSTIRRTLRLAGLLRKAA